MHCVFFTAERFETSLGPPTATGGEVPTMRQSKKLKPNVIRLLNVFQYNMFMLYFLSVEFSTEVLP